MSEANEVEDKARQMGWVPKEEFRGDEAKWVDADAFVERGDQIMPILRKNNERLLAENAATKQEVERLKGLAQASQDAIAELKRFHSADTARQVEKAKRDLVAGIKQAKKDGDTDLETDLQESLSELKSAEKGVKEEMANVPTPPQPVVDPSFIAWRNENPWFGVDRRKTALAVAAAEEMRADPRNNGIIGKQFYDMAAADAEAFLHPGKKGPSKLEEGSGRHTSNGAGGPRAKGYADLPQEAKDVCTRQGKNLVGTGRAFKTEKEWQQHYAEQYFLGE